MIENESEREAAYNVLHRWQSIAADGKQSTEDRQSAQAEVVRCARMIAEYEREHFAPRSQRESSTAVSPVPAPQSVAHSAAEASSPAAAASSAPMPHVLSTLFRRLSGQGRV